MQNAAHSPKSHFTPDGSPEALSPRPAASLVFKDIGYQKEGGIATITLQRPRYFNAYSTQTLGELLRAIHDATLDDSVGVLVLTGTGTQAFCTGGDVREYASAYTERPADYWKYMNLFRSAVEAILRCGKPTIARLNGITVGGGNELHLACDFSVAGSHIYLGQVGVGVGSVACGGATQWLPLAVGDRRARSMLMLNERVPAATALEWGLVTQVSPTIAREGEVLPWPTPLEVELARRGMEQYSVDLTRLDEDVKTLAGRLLGMFPECLRYTKLQTNFWKELSWNQTVGHGQEWLALHFATREPHEGMGAFVEKRPPRIRLLRDEIAHGRSGDYLHGAPIRTCPVCGTRQIPEGFRFCGSCGSPLEGQPKGGR